MEQSDATAVGGYWHASINEARSVLEALLVSIVRTVYANDARKPGTGNGTAFSVYRRYLVDAGFMDAYESDVLHFVYGLGSAKGSHHGVPDEAWNHLARRMVSCTCAYLLHRLAEWKQRPPEDRTPSVTTDSAPADTASPAQKLWPRWWQRLSFRQRTK